MLFSDFEQLLPAISKVGLPAEAAHKLLSPPERSRLMERLDFKSLNPRQAAVMILCYPRVDETNFVLILRNSYNGVHSSQVAFPGGKKEDSDTSFSHTALRETSEEVGLDVSEMEIIREFSQVYIPPSNFLVRPFLGICRKPPVFFPDVREVAQVIEVPLSLFLDDASLVSVSRQTSYVAETTVPAFRIEEHIVWGATAMILSEFKEVLKTLINP